MKRIGEMYIRIARVLLAVFLLGMVVLVFGNVCCATPSTPA